MGHNFGALRQHNYWNVIGESGAANISESQFDDLISKATYDTSTASLVNDLYGAVLYAWYNQEHRWLQAIPQVDRFGEATLGDPIAKSFRVAHSPVQLDTHAEGGSISTARTMGIEEVSYEVKRSETVLEESDLQQIEAVIEDAVGFDELWDLQQDQLGLAVDRDAIAAPVNTGDAAYADTDTVTKLDRAIASQDEEANADDTDDNAYSDGDLDYGTIDRSADAWGDAFVDHNSVAGDRQLTRDLMDDFLNGLGDHGSVDPYEESVILTTRGTANVLSDLMADSSRGTRISFDGDGGSGTDQVNDAETLVGLAGTTRFRHYDGIPIIPNQNGPTDSIGRIFVLPMSTINGEPRVAIENYAEPYVERAGRGQTQGYIAQGSYTEQALFLLNHELVIRDIASTGKLRDLSE